MRCEKCGNEAPRVTRLRGERQFICRRCREQQPPDAKKPTPALQQYR